MLLFKRISTQKASIERIEALRKAASRRMSGVGVCFYVVKVNDVSLGHKKRENTRDIHLSSTSQLFYDKKKKNSRFSHTPALISLNREKSEWG